MNWLNLGPTPQSRGDPSEWVEAQPTRQPPCGLWMGCLGHGSLWAVLWNWSLFLAPLSALPDRSSQCSLRNFSEMHSPPGRLSELCSMCISVIHLHIHSRTHLAGGEGSCKHWNVVARHGSFFPRAYITTGTTNKKTNIDCGRNIGMKKTTVLLRSCQSVPELRSQGRPLTPLFLPVATLCPPWPLRTGSVIFILVLPAPGKVLRTGGILSRSVSWVSELSSWLVVASGWLGPYLYPTGGWDTEDECPFVCHSGGYCELFYSIHVFRVVVLNYDSPSFKIPLLGIPLVAQR